MSRMGERWSGASLSIGPLVVTSILAGTDGRSTRTSPVGAEGRGVAGTVPAPPPAHALTEIPASTPSGSIHRICRNTSTAIICATLSLARPTALVVHDD